MKMEAMLSLSTEPQSISTVSPAGLFANREKVDGAFSASIPEDVRVSFS
jgi:hypothetical protein